ncbi:MAG: biotin synthase, partial [Serpentinimonas sp.]|nr:biotin synthase [Serpentinimonas sp.]
MNTCSASTAATATATESSISIAAFKSAKKISSSAKIVESEASLRWPQAAIEALYALPLLDLLFQAQQVHRQHFDPNEVQLSTLLSIKTGGCAEDCGYCPQSAHFDAGIEASKLMPLDAVLQAASDAKAQGASRFCMGAAWRSPKMRDLQRVTEMVQGVRALGLETCMTLGMLDAEQAQQLKSAGLDYYNHN